MPTPSQLARYQLYDIAGLHPELENVCNLLLDKPDAEMMQCFTKLVQALRSKSKEVR